MEKLSMRYCYTYREQWQPKDIPVDFRMYQLNLDGEEGRVYRGYWEKYPHFIEELGGKAGKTERRRKRWTEKRKWKR